MTIDPVLVKQAKDFHGHWCPGLAIGIRAAEWALKEMGKTPDEEIVAVVETDMCAVDAIQSLIGCTFGKGNLIHKDYGKTAFTFYRRKDGKGARLVARQDLHGEARVTLGRLNKKMREEGLSEEEEKVWYETREGIAKRIMESGLEDIFQIEPAVDPAPKKARVVSSLICESCGESVMETRTRRFQEKVLCIPCFENMEKRY